MDLESSDTSAEEQMEGESSGDSSNTPSSSSDDKETSPDDSSEGGASKGNMVPQSRLNEYAAELRQAREEIGGLKSQIEELRSPKEETTTNKDDEWGDDDEPVTAAKLKELDRKQQERFEAQRQRDKLNDKFDQYEHEVDGSDGRPPFRREEVREWVKKNPDDAHPDPLRVYKVMHEEKLRSWHIEQAKKKEKAVHLESGKAKKEPPNVDTSKMTEQEYDNYVKQKYSDRLSN